MDQMADETTPRADVKDKRGVNSAEGTATWVRGEGIQSMSQVSDWRLGTSAEPGESEGTDTKQPRECDGSTSPFFSLKMYLRRTSSASSHTTDSLSSSQHRNMGVDCAGMVLSCLFCRFYDMIHMLPEGLTNHCCPDYKQVVSSVESTPSTDEDFCTDLDCGLLSSCQDASDCLELAMEVSELCYH